MSKRKVLVTSNFIQTTQSIQNYLSEYSNESAAKFTNALKTKMQKVVTHPEGYPPVRQLPTKKNWVHLKMSHFLRIQSVVTQIERFQRSKISKP